MEILGVGLPELVFVLLIALIFMGPKDLEKAGRTVGTFLRKVVTSEEWMLFKKTTRQLGNLPSKLMRDAQELERQAGLSDPAGQNRKYPPIQPREELGAWYAGRQTAAPPVIAPEKKSDSEDRS